MIPVPFSTFQFYVYDTAKDWYRPLLVLGAPLFLSLLLQQGKMADIISHKPRVFNQKCIFTHHQTAFNYLFVCLPVTCVFFDARCPVV